MMRRKKHRKQIHKQPEYPNRRLQSENPGALKTGRKKYLIIIRNRKKLKDFYNRYFEKANLHEACFKKLNFTNIRFQNSIVTNCNFRGANLKGVDFCNCNLRDTVFKDAHLERCLFINCNLKDADFSGAVFNDVYFITANIKDTKGLPDNAIILDEYPMDLELTNRMQRTLSVLAGRQELYKYHVLHVKPEKPNKWILKILFDKYGVEETGRALNCISRRMKEPKRFYTLNSYMRFIEAYLYL